MCFFGENFLWIWNAETATPYLRSIFFKLSVGLKSSIVNSSKPGRLQARIIGENWVWIPTWTYSQGCWTFQSVRTLRQKANALNNQCAFATNASSKSAKFGLLQFDCILDVSRIRHLLLLLICVQGWITPVFSAQTYQ